MSTDENPDVRMVERAIEGEAEQDAQAQEDAEEEHCYSVACDVVNEVQEIYEHGEGDEKSRRFVCDMLIKERKKAYDSLAADLLTDGEKELRGQLKDAKARIARLQDEVVGHCEDLNDAKVRVYLLRQALQSAHACATLHADGTCDGCPVSEALGVTR